MTIPVMGWAARVWHAKNTRVALCENGSTRAFIATPSFLKMGQPTNAEKRALWLAGQHASAEVDAPDLDKEEVDRRMLRVIKGMEGRVQRLEELEVQVEALRAYTRELEASEHSACERANRLAGECHDLQAKLEAAIEDKWADVRLEREVCAALADKAGPMTETALDLARRILKQKAAYDRREAKPSTMFSDANFTKEEPCDSCDATECVVHMGHGSFSCESCYRKWWCKDCGYDARGKNHRCPTPEERHKHEMDNWRMWVNLDGLEEAEKEWGPNPEMVMLARAVVEALKKGTR